MSNSWWTRSHFFPWAFSIWTKLAFRQCGWLKGWTHHYPSFIFTLTVYCFCIECYQNIINVLFIILLGSSSSSSRGDTAILPCQNHCLNNCHVLVVVTPLNFITAPWLRVRLLYHSTFGPTQSSPQLQGFRASLPPDLQPLFPSKYSSLHKWYSYCSLCEMKFKWQKTTLFPHCILAMWSCTNHSSHCSDERALNSKPGFEFKHCHVLICWTSNKLFSFLVH